MAIKVLAPGLATTVQDLGRPGYYHLGIPLSGGMDRFALRAANMLVGNDEGAAVLEAVFMGPELEFGEDATVAVAGAELRPKVDGEARDTWTSFSVQKGQVLSFEFLKAGARAYIAVSGGIDVPVVLGSRSTYPLGALGGFKGRSLQAGDVLPRRQRPRRGRGALGRRQSSAACPASRPSCACFPGSTGTGSPRRRGGTSSPTPGRSRPRRTASATASAPAGRSQFVERKQPFGAGSDPSNIVDACYPYGSIQVPGGTEPIVLHRDAVSGGGYCMIGTVISADMDLVGQLQPHTETRFVEVDMPAALKARHDRAAMLDASGRAWRERIRLPRSRRRSPLGVAQRHARAQKVRLVAAARVPLASSGPAARARG